MLNLSKKNVKAFFRRAQARVALQKLGEAHNGACLSSPFSDMFGFTLSPADLQWALKIEPKNDAVKAELERVDELILSKKGIPVRSLDLNYSCLTTNAANRARRRSHLATRVVDV